MKTGQILLKACALIALSASISFGADLATYQGKYAAAMKSIRDDAGTNYELLVTRYAAALQGIREKSQRNGELEELKAVLAEAARFTGEKTVSAKDVTGSFPALKKMQTTFIREADGQTRAESERICSLTKKYDRVLAQLQVELTKEGQIDDASVVLAERKKVKTMIDMIEASAPAGGQMQKNEASPAADGEIAGKPNAGSGSVTMKAFIDIQDVLKIQGNKMWYEHVSGALPGKWADQNQPTFINKKAWMPVWESSISKPYEGIKPEISAGTARVRTITGRGKITILEQPGLENDYTLAVSLFDPAGGAAWTEFEVRWDGAPIPANQQVADDSALTIPPPGVGTPCIVYWSCADAADVYVNGKPLRHYKPSFYTRPDEANKDFSAETAISKNDVITIGARRGGSFGVLLVVVDKATDKVIWKTDTENWKVYVPVNTTKWYLPEKAAVARKAKPLLQKDPWGPQVGLQGRYDGARVQSIWAAPDDQYVYFVSTVR